MSCSDIDVFYSGIIIVLTMLWFYCGIWFSNDGIVIHTPISIRKTSNHDGIVMV